MSVCRFGQEDLGCVARVDTRVFEQEPQVKQVPALHALHHAAQLLAGYLFERVCSNRAGLRQIRPPL